jgi:hypothetical protein
MADRVERSVDRLQQLYAVVMALALTEAFKNIVTTTNIALPNGSILEKALRTESWPFIAFLVTIVPFFHGANRHLDEVYIFGKSVVKDFALLIDFLFFFLHGAVFYWLALVIQHPRHFFRVYCFLLVLDILWAVGVFFYADTGWRKVRKWTVINLATVGIALIILNTPLLTADSQLHALGTVAVLRSVFDYVLQWSTYYPRAQSSSASRSFGYSEH